MRFYPFLPWLHRKFPEIRQACPEGELMFKLAEWVVNWNHEKCYETKEKLNVWFDECIYVMIDKLASRFYWPIFMGKDWRRQGILAAFACYLCTVQLSRRGRKDWGCIKKHPLGWLTGLALNSCSSLFYAAACLCVGGREKKNTRD